MTTPPAPLIASYGRRRGRPLRAARAALMETLLPRLTIAAPDPGGTVEPAGLFARAPTQVWLEIGFGGGEHLAQQAETHRDIGFIGAEPYLNGVAGLLARVDRDGLDNIRLWPGDIRALLPAFPGNSISRVFVLFPDPWPKARHHKRRLIAPALLDALARVMAPAAMLRIATDDADYRDHILACLGAHAAFQGAGGGSGILPGRPADWPATRYESKAAAAGRRSTYLCFVRRGGGKTP